MAHNYIGAGLEDIRRIYVHQDQRSSYGGGTSSSVSLGDKRNRNPNWTDGEIIRFLEILQEQDTLRDLMAQRNKQVFCHVAQRLSTEGAEKSWDQCRIKLKNLKSQYRYIKERVPGIATADLEDDEIMKRLISECQGRGISPSSLKHLRYLRRFLTKLNHLKGGGEAGGGASGADDSMMSPPSPPPTIRIEKAFSHSQPQPPPQPQQHHVLQQQLQQQQHLQESKDDRESVSPPTTPYPLRDIKILSDEPEEVIAEPDLKRPRLEPRDLAQDLSHGQRYIEQFNQAMVQHFLDHQRRVQADYQKWELEHQRQHEMAMERLRQQARDHEKQMLGIFVKVLKECNSAMTNMMEVKVHNRSTSTSGGNDNVGGAAGQGGDDDEMEEEEEDMLRAGADDEESDGSK